MNKKLIDQIISNFSIVEIENELFSQYIKHKNLVLAKESKFSDLLISHSPSKELSESISKLNATTFERLENAMELLIPTDDRKQNGAFFTPSFIVDYMLNELKPLDEDSIMDPSCGCGAFLIGTLRYYLKKGKTVSSIIKQNIHGIDILEYNVRRAKLLIILFALEHGEVVDYSSINISVANSLTFETNTFFDVVIGNPPYVKFQDLNEENRTFLKSSFESVNKGTYNLYFAFFELGYKLLKNKSSRLGYITPNNYFTSLAGESLRKYFSSKSMVYKIIDFNHFRVFNAQTYTCLTFINKKENNNILFDKLFDNDIKSFLISSQLSNVDKRSLNDKKWRLLRSTEQKNIKKIESSGLTLKDLFVINVGIATLKDSLYIVDFYDSETKYYFKTFNGREYPIEKGLVKSLYKISDFENQHECDRNTNKIIFPYQIIKGKSIIYTESDLAKLFPLGYQYLLAIRTELDSRGNVALNPFYLYGRSQGLNKFGTRLLTPTFSQKPRFLIVKEKNSLYCNGYGLHLKSDFSENLSLFDNHLIQQEENIDVLQKILNSEVMHYYVSHTSVSIEGGYPCYQKNFIESFTIPELNEEQIIKIRELNDGCLTTFLEELYSIKLGLPKRS